MKMSSCWLLTLGLLAARPLGAASLDLLQGDWEEACRPSTNEAGAVLKTGAFLGLRSRYARAGANRLTWTVTSYVDAQCLREHESNRYTFECLETEDPGLLRCTQALYEKRVGSKAAFKAQPLLDHARVPIVMKLQYKVESLGSNRLRLTVLSEDADGPAPVELQRVRATKP
jgi:hypothetical protein